MKKWLGYALFALSTLAWLVAIGLPFVVRDTSAVAGYITGILIAAEVLFVGAMALLGKAFMEPLKRYFRTIFISPAGLRWLPVFFLITDVGFILYWLITALALLPAEWLFKDYQNPILSAWNWSFLPLDLLVSATGLYSLYLRKQGKDWRLWAFASLVLTSCSGLMAVSFWVIHHDFDWGWWLPNLYLLIYPLFFVGKLNFSSK